MPKLTKQETIDLFAGVPGIGKGLAARIVEGLEIETLSALQAAAEDGRLQEVNGFGKRRVEQVAQALAGRDLAPAPAAAKAADVSAEDTPTPAAAAPEPAAPTEPPSVALLLELDAAYRRKAAAGDLNRVAASGRAAAEGEATLPVMRQEQGPWSFTVYFSNTVRARQHDKTRDWVLISYRYRGEAQRNTVVTETEGALAGKRVVRGREQACADHYGVTL